MPLKRENNEGLLLVTTKKKLDYNTLRNMFTLLQQRDEKQIYFNRNYCVINMVNLCKKYFSLAKEEIAVSQQGSRFSIEQLLENEEFICQIRDSCCDSVFQRLSDELGDQVDVVIDRLAELEHADKQTIEFEVSESISGSVYEPARKNEKVPNILPQLDENSSFDIVKPLHDGATQKPLFGTKSRSVMKIPSKELLIDVKLNDESEEENTDFAIIKQNVFARPDDSEIEQKIVKPWDCSEDRTFTSSSEYSLKIELPKTALACNARYIEEIPEGVYKNPVTSTATTHKLLKLQSYESDDDAPTNPLFKQESIGKIVVSPELNELKTLRPEREGTQPPRRTKSLLKKSKQ